MPGRRKTGKRPKPTPEQIAAAQRTMEALRETREEEERVPFWQREDRQHQD
jgi:hypothetical protein